MSDAVRMMLVEDNATDAELAMRVFKRQKLADRVDVVTDGEEALRRVAASRAASHRAPAVVVLDLKLPKVDGLEVLRRLKSAESTREIPVIVLSSSREDRDIAESYRRGANSYVVKPIDPDEFERVLTRLAQYWLTLNQAPA